MEARARGSQADEPVETPVETFGMNRPQIPDEPIGSIGSAPVSQPLKSPTTETYSAFGAQTAKWNPDLPSRWHGWAPSFS